jgi:hypothetical protein
LTPEVLKEFQNSEYEVHQVGSNGACSQNFSFLALNTAELAAPQISSKNRRQRRVTNGKKNSLLTRFYFHHSRNVHLNTRRVGLVLIVLESTILSQH